MGTKILKIGNSLSVYIPINIARKIGLTQGMPVSVRSVGRRIIVESESRPETLQDLLKRVNLKNHQPLIDFGVDTGREVIDR